MDLNATPMDNNYYYSDPTKPADNSNYFTAVNEQVAGYALGYQLLNDVMSTTAPSIHQSQVAYNDAYGYSNGSLNGGLGDPTGYQQQTQGAYDAAYQQPAYGAAMDYQQQPTSYDYTQQQAPQQAAYMQPYTTPHTSSLNNWAEYILPDGRKYWHDSISGTSQWDKPPGLL
mmetsp:Transcript_20487/g.33660  ORF Transcript_20487/g.33660 Transcript_20487/m.33660 type:complete len:171 (+) Transcript_20487:88-600(+)